MKPGDVRVFQEGNHRALVLAVGIWANRRKKTWPIHIHITGTKRFHTTVVDRSGSERYHRTLFRDLWRLLVQDGRWPFGDEGAETEAKGHR
jgi:hypothetical protein